MEKGTLILYDDSTRSHWSQLVGEAVQGPMQGQKLVKLPSTMTTWTKWKALHPDTTVYVKRSIPYHARFTAQTFADQVARPDGALGERDLILGVEGHIEARAYPLKRLARNGPVNDSLEGTPILAYLTDDQATARVVIRRAGDRTLTFSENEEGSLEDRETGSIWDPVSGKAIAGPLQGAELQPLVTTTSLWFAWKEYRPDTKVFGETSETQ